ncbi:unnamed protein product [Phaeothamnion confervicola]
MAVKPWIGAVKAPSNPQPERPGPPALRLALEHVHGVRASGDTRGNVWYTAVTAEIVFCAAALGVIMTIDANGGGDGDNGGNDGGGQADLGGGGGPPAVRQRFHTGHDDDVTCLTVSADRRFVATGEQGRTAAVRVWDSGSGALLAALKNAHKRGVAALAFSPDGDRLASVGMDDEHTHVVWRDGGGGWSGAAQEASGRGDGDKVLWAQWLPADAAGTRGGGGTEQLVTGGVKHVKFWLCTGRTLKAKKGVFGKVGKIQPIICAAAVPLSGGVHLVTGTASGELYVWGANGAVTDARPAHDGGVNCLSTGRGGGGGAPHGTVLVTGGRDGRIKLWSASWECLADYSLKDLGTSVDPCVRSVDADFGGGSGGRATILAGTQGSEIYEFSAHDKGAGTAVDLHGGPLLRGHCQGELWGLDMGPLPAMAAEAATSAGRASLGGAGVGETFATAGDDGTVRVWSVAERRMLALVAVGEPARAVAWERNGGGLLAVGLGDGSSGSSNGGGGGRKRGGRGGNAKADANRAGEIAVIRVTGFGGGSGSGDSNRGDGGGGIIALAVMAGAEQHDAKEWISALQWSPDGARLAAGSHDNNIYLYENHQAPVAAVGGASADPADNPAAADGDRRSGGGNGGGGKGKGKGAAWATVLSLQGTGSGKLERHHSYVTHLDWCCEEGGNGKRYLQSTSGDYELLFWDADAGRQIPSATAMRDRDWHTWTLPLGWPVQGIWPAGADGTDINAVARSPDRKYVATADDSGKLKVFNYPCVSARAEAVVACGHSSHVTNVAWTHDQQRVVTVGGNDKCVIVWRVIKT